MIINVLRSLVCLLEFLDMEAILSEIFYDGLVEFLGHDGCAVVDPEVVVVWGADNCVAVGLIQSDDPVVSSSGVGGHLEFEFGVAVFSVLGVGEG